MLEIKKMYDEKIRTNERRKVDLHFLNQFYIRLGIVI